MSCVKNSSLKHGLQLENHLLPKNVDSTENTPFMNLKDRMEYYNVPGMSYCIIENDSIILSRAYGFKDLKNKIKVDTNTLFQSASTGKSLTATIAIILVNEGKLELDRDINDYLRTWKVPVNKFNESSPITLRMLLSHTSGLSTHGFDGYKRTDSLPNIYQILNGEFPANSEKVTSKIASNSKWQYSGGGYQVIQLLIEEVTGKSFVEVAKEKLLKPLELKNSVWKTRLPKKHHGKASKEYHKGNTELEGGWYNLASNGAGGGLWTTPKDLAKFIIALNKSKTQTTPIHISHLLAKEMQLNQSPDRAFGLGLFLDKKESYNAIYHPGGNMGFRTMMYYLPKTKQGIVIMSNSDNSWYLIPELMRAASYVYNWPSYKPVKIGKQSIVSNNIHNYLETKNYNALKKQSETLLIDDSNKLNIYEELSNVGASQYQIWRMNEAITIFKLSNILFKDSLDTYINLGMAYRRNEDYIKAKVVFENGLKIDSSDIFIKEKIKELTLKINTREN